MQNDLEIFIKQIPNLEDKNPSELIDYFVYYLTIVNKQDGATASDIENCFNICHLQKYSNISTYLNRGLTKSRKGGSAKYIRKPKGFRLERKTETSLKTTLANSPARIETSHLMRDLLTKLTSEDESTFLQEAIDCYEIGARRAAIVMTWLLTVSHLNHYVFENELTDFNTALSKNTDKRVKITKVSKIDNFAEIPEGKLIEFLRSAKIISNDVRKILDTKLGIRNSTAHPSSVKLSEVKTTDFIIDLVENVILKYPR